jgi:hypothetical protein
MKSPSDKLQVLERHPEAAIACHLLLKAKREPFWYVRAELGGLPLSAIHRSPHSAWKDAAQRIRTDFDARNRAELDAINRRLLGAGPISGAE